MISNEEIDTLLDKYPFLKCNVVYERDINYIKEVLNLPYWQETKNKKLLTTNIWYSSYANIVNIMELPFWDDPKFGKVLTSNIWKRRAAGVKKTLELSEWNEEEYQQLLTSNIWKSSYESILEIFSIEELKDLRYKHLLVPSIFNVQTENIIPTINLLDEYEISEYITNRCLRRNVGLTRKLIEIMINNNIPLLTVYKNELKLNRMLSDSNSYLKTTYGIDFLDLETQKLIRTK